MKIQEILEQASVIPVLEIDSIDAAAPLAKALESGGLRVVELTLRTECAIEAIGEMKNAAPNLIIGMGTIRTDGDIERSLSNGAEFLVSPGASRALLSSLDLTGAPALPGVATASEAMTAFEAGFKALKFFPAEAAGGVSYLKSLAGPLPDIIFCPTGGIKIEHAADYLSLPNVACIGGSWVASKSMIAAHDWEGVEANAHSAAKLV